MCHRRRVKIPCDCRGDLILAAQAKCLPRTFIQWPFWFLSTLRFLDCMTENFLGWVQSVLIFRLKMQIRSEHQFTFGKCQRKNSAVGFIKRSRSVQRSSGCVRCRTGRNSATVPVTGDVFTQHGCHVFFLFGLLDDFLIVLQNSWQIAASPGSLLVSNASCPSVALALSCLIRSFLKVSEPAHGVRGTTLFSLFPLLDWVHWG